MNDSNKYVTYENANSETSSHHLKRFSILLFSVLSISALGMIGLNTFNINYYDDDKRIEISEWKASSDEEFDLEVEIARNDNKEEANVIIGKPNVNDDNVVVENSEENSVETNENVEIKYENILFVKTPKVGGTTLTLILQRFAKLNNLTVGIPHNRLAKDTCYLTSTSSALRSWKDAILKHNPKGGFNIFSSQVCLRNFMVDKDHWKGKTKQPLLLGLVREPWSRWVSAWRYLEKRCEEKDPTMPAPVAKLCYTRLPQGFAKVTENECILQNKCSYQYAWMFGKTSGKISYDFVLVIEEFDLSLLVLHYDYGIPLQVLTYLIANKDSSAEMPKFSNQIKQNALKHGLNRDSIIYERAKKYLFSRVAELKATNGEEFDLKLKQLKEMNAIIQQKCSKDDALIENDCLVSHPMIMKKFGCRHACLDSVAKEYFMQK